MSSYIREQKKILKQGIRQHITEQCDKVNNGQYTGEDLAKEMREYRSTEKPSNFFVWKRLHKNTGVYASWKDDNILKWTYKELTRARTFPWLVAAVSWYGFVFLFPHPTQEDLKKSPNFHPHGHPPGSNMTPHYQHLVHEIEAPPKY
ncbi:hypothetical protein FDP41_007117 [Naegleria fowleri]|uniref:Uncharacterized protein n=1 Tax=Naegleria fowleri TaxID=5763 RepID=A0A6A5BI56_NAEFO|nr:uncharacterized protein FDP41_007117 [Naegleria fowleri]KAF0973730.1 hypothetical protein FDP41_007117 [Naegleria fowleri]CAG4712456.1 unnamed protein product [Naegleria fowleri]